MAEPTTPHPNILFIIMDDVGIDQLQTFGYGGATPPATPNITQIADAGIRFRNTWSMPACSPSRAVLFEGRYPMRTNVLGALGPNDLANSMVGPFEMTAPRLLKERDYQSALFGKFHLGLQGNSPFGYAMPRSLGWDYFFGWLDASGDPSSIDTTCRRRGPGRNLLLRICAGSRRRRSRPRRLLLARRYLPRHGGRGSEPAWPGVPRRRRHLRPEPVMQGAATIQYRLHGVERALRVACW